MGAALARRSGGWGLQELRRAFKALYVASKGCDLALEARRRNLADPASFGRAIIAGHPATVRAVVSRREPETQWVG